MSLVFLILAITTICFAIPRFRSDLVALCSLLALFLTGVISVSEALAGFSSTVVIMLAVLFVVGEGISQTGLAGKAGSLLVKITGNSEFKTLVFMQLLVAIMGSFISNTGTVAILIPVVVSLCARVGVHPSKLLMPLAFGASMSGALTLIGTAPNLLARDALLSGGYGTLSFFDFTPIGLIVLFTGIIYMWLVGRKMLDKPFEQKSKNADTISVSELLNHYKADRLLHCVNVPADSEVIGRALKSLQWARLYNVTVLKIRKAEKRFLAANQQVLALPSSVPEADDTLLIYATRADMDKFLAETGLELLPRDSVENLHIQDENIAEIILTPQSSLINQSLRDVAFRDKYGITILSVKPRNMDAKMPLAQEPLKYGDSMLAYGQWKDIDLLAKERGELVVICHKTTEAEVFKPLRAILAGAVLLAMVVMLVLDIIPAVMTILVAGLLMVLTRCVTSTDRAYRAVNWNVVVLIACMLPMATALENTGGVTFIADSIINTLGDAGPRAIMLALYVLTSLFGVFISNTATAVLFLPVALITAQQMGVSPLPLVMAVTYASSMSFATPVSTPPNAMVMVAGKYKFVDYMKVGIPLQFLVGTVVLLVLPVFFPF
ncbi:MAG: SLC13 family permease [Defluviitaleaceae bacterium]|nr:SLC13 family permease [Defluviitaleaceae bacterium]